MKKRITLGICAVLLATVAVIAFGITARADTGIGVEPGEEMPDFTVSLTDGSTATLSDLLKEKDLVVLNIFATWCGPCEREFPDMENVYRANSDKMEIISVSGDPSDTMEMVSAYKDSHGLSFPMGVAGDGLDFLTVTGFPTSIFIDKNQMIGFVKIGAFTDTGAFEGKVDTFLSRDYDGQPLASEKAVSRLPYLLGYMFFGGLVMIVGRWGILKKAGRRGWHSLIPILNIYKEFSICWKGWIGLIYVLCMMLIPVYNYIANENQLSGAGAYVLIGVATLISFGEGLKLAAAFGKGTVWGILLFIPGFREICRVILGFGKAEYNN